MDFFYTRYRMARIVKFFHPFLRFPMTCCRHRELIITFVVRELKGRYMGSTLGMLWTVIHPLILLVVYVFVFSKIIGVRYSLGPSSLENFALYMFCGMVPWLAFSEAVGRSPTLLFENGNLIKRVAFPSEILPFYVVIAGLVNLFIGVAIIIAASLIIFQHISIALLLFPVLLVFQVIFTLGLAYFLSAINVFIRDVQQAIPVFLTLWMFLTPIFYPLEIVPKEFRKFLFLNPMTYVVNGYRDMFLERIKEITLEGESTLRGVISEKRFEAAERGEPGEVLVVAIHEWNLRNEEILEPQDRMGKFESPTITVRGAGKNFVIHDIDFERRGWEELVWSSGEDSYITSASLKSGTVEIERKTIQKIRSIIKFDVEKLLIFVGISVCVFAFGYLYFYYTRKKFADEI